MTVAELIARLQEYVPTAEIILNGHPDETATIYAANMVPPYWPEWLTVYSSADDE